VSEGTWSFYDPATGMFTGDLFSGPHDSLAANTPAGKVALQGRFDHLAQRLDVESGLVVSWIPSQPDADHEWNPTIRRWMLAADIARRRYNHDAALEGIDAAERRQLRAMRELALDPNNSEARQRLQQIDQEIAALRDDLISA